MVVSEQVFKWNPVGQGQGQLVVHEAVKVASNSTNGFTIPVRYSQFHVRFVIARHKSIDWGRNIL